MNKFQLLITQVEAFIRKYYTNQMVKGAILFSGILLLSYFVVSGVEYLGRFGSAVRLLLLVGFISTNVFLLLRFLIIPLFKLNKLGKRITPFEASDMIGDIFPDISDKLRNTLQLHEHRQDYSINLELINASIEQRSSKLSVIPFASGIDLTNNKKYLRFLVPVLVLIALVAIVNPKLFSEGTERVVYFNEEFVEPAPFEFEMVSDDEAKEGDDYLLKMKLVGEEIPNELKIHTNTGTYNLDKTSPIEFGHQFANLSESLEFTCESNGYTSEVFQVKLLRKPVIEAISMTVNYPRHTGLKPEKFENTGDLTIPEGSDIKWNISARNLTKLDARFGDTSIVLNTSLSNSYSFQRKFRSSQKYSLTFSSVEIENADSLQYNIGVIKDEFPTISVSEEADSANPLRRFVEGSISDDYGFRSLTATIKVTGPDTSYTLRKVIPVKGSATQQLFSYFFDIGEFKLGPGYSLEYFFSVTDNDEPNGYKTSVSNRQVFAVPELDQLDNALSKKDDALKDQMENALKDAFQLNKKIEETRSNLVNKPDLDWKDRQTLENLLNMHQNLNQKIEQMKEDFEEVKIEKENFLENSEELIEKQKQLQELIDQLMDEEMKALMEELQQLMNEMNKEELLENLEKMEMESQNMEEDLDRALELFKNMELDSKLENLEEQLKELAKEQDELQKQTEDKALSKEELSEKQDEINKKFDEIQKDIDEIEKKNEELENPREMDFNEETEQQIEEQTNEAKENIEQEKNKKASENQQNASEQMEKMAGQVSQMQSQQQQEQQAEDMDALRYLLENLVALSYDQEDVMDEFSTARVNDPYYLDLNRRQLDIDRNTETVSDSLIALSKRVFQLSGFINEELSELEYNLEKSLIYSEDRKTKDLQQHQQYTMTGYNDLALMLSEVLSQMQQQAQSKGQPGSGSCNNPGGSGQGSSPGKMSMQQMKDAMKGQIEKMKGGTKPGGEDGQGKQGEKMGNGGPGGMIPGLSAKEIAKMAAQQGQIKQSLKEMRQELNKDGSGSGNQLNDLIEDIEQLQDDLLNGRIDEKFSTKQQDILTRLLEHEKAMRERGYDEQRESKDGKNPEEGNQIEFTEYKRKKDAEIEFLRSLPVELRVYYKALVNEYFNSVND